MNLPRVYMRSPSWTPLQPLSLYHPVESSQCTSPQHLVSCFEPGLVIRFIYDIIRFNAILPNHPTLSLSHRVQKPVLYICVSFAVLHTGLSRFPFNRTHVQFNITYAQKNLPEVSGCFLFSPLPSLISKLEILVLLTYSLRNNKIQHALTCSFDIRKNNQLKLLSGLYTT